MAEYLYDIGGIDTSMPFAELAKVCMVNVKAQDADRDPNFSEKIREGVPMPQPDTMQEFLAKP